MSTILSEPVFKYTEALLLDAVGRKYSPDALLRQVTLDDAESQVEFEQSLEHYPFKIHPFYRRIDGLLLQHKCRTAIEVKCSRSDYRNESDPKRRAWRKHTNRFVYLTPPGLLRVAEIPDGIGLWESDGQTVTVVKRAVRQEAVDFPPSFVDTLMYRLFSAEIKMRSGI